MSGDLQVQQSFACFEHTTVGPGVFWTTQSVIEEIISESCFKFTLTLVTIILMDQSERDLCQHHETQTHSSSKSNQPTKNFNLKDDLSMLSPPRTVETTGCCPIFQQLFVK